MDGLSQETGTERLGNSRLEIETVHSYDQYFSRVGATYVYDANGNQQIEQSAIGNRTTTTWNFENQPTLYRLPAGSRVTMIYNGDNRRVRIQEP